MNIKKIIIGSIRDEDSYIYGFSDLRGLLNSKFHGFKYGITIGRRLDDNIMDAVRGGPTREYYDLYNTVNNELTNIGENISGKLDIMNVKNIFIKPTISDEEYNQVIENNMAYEFSHKMAATRAGLGWIGKTDLFISKKFGPRLRLATILTKDALPYSKTTIDESKCGNCSRCVEACPAKAANGKLWNINITRDEFYDAGKCRSKCKELSRLNINKDISICGICVSVCPVGNA